MEYANYIAHCIKIARRGEYFVAPNPMVGAVLVDSNGQILAEGWHEKYGEAHAEVNCFRNFENSEVRSQISDLKDCTLFVSLEPCSHYGKTPPCADLIIAKGVGRVVVGMLDPNPLVAGKGVQKLRDAGIEVVVGVMEKECRELNKRFLCLHEKKRPYVILKWAETSDAFIDRKRQTSDVRIQKSDHLNGALAISTPETKKLVHKMRAENMAIMVGTNTVLLDNPRLLNTHWQGRNPIRVTVDRHNRIPADARIFSDENGGNETIVYRDRTDWPYILTDLANRNIHSILVEGGTTLLTHILESGLWDEIHIEVAPELAIGDGVPAPKVMLPAHCEIVDGHKLYVLNNLLARYDQDQIVMVCDKKISELRIQNSDLGFPIFHCPSLPLSVSEADKSIETVSRIWDFLLEHGITRRGLLVCVGGGVLTDIGGFAAATYKRGIDYINVPTTLLAMIDASSGGKTGVNYHGLKNCIGVFAPPVETVILPEWLKTLPAKEILSGFGEMLKTGLIESADRLWNRLLNYDLDRMDIDELTPLINDCVAVKERIVAADPKEEGLRKVLNFGHTFGHALEEISLTGEAGQTVKRSDSETVQQRSGLLHGYAVVYGLIAELYLSVVKLNCPKQPLQQLTQLMLHYYGKPQCKCSDRKQLIALMQQDKKNERTAQINCTLLHDIGSPVINQIISPEEAEEALDYLFSL